MVYWLSEKKDIGSEKKERRSKGSQGGDGRHGDRVWRTYGTHRITRSEPPVTQGVGGIHFFRLHSVGDERGQ